MPSFELNMHYDMKLSTFMREGSLALRIKCIPKDDSTSVTIECTNVKLTNMKINIDRGPPISFIDNEEIFEIDVPSEKSLLLHFTFVEVTLYDANLKQEFTCIEGSNLSVSEILQQLNIYLINRRTKTKGKHCATIRRQFFVDTKINVST